MLRLLNEDAGWTGEGAVYSARGQPGGGSLVTYFWDAVLATGRPTMLQARADPGRLGGDAARRLLPLSRNARDRCGISAGHAAGAACRKARDFEPKEAG